ncbi:hypothetical protein GEV33_002687 [Tenebrio molitor]|uniref:Venom dipeptidyl peptidase 4 n=1 Tax=Tenebrio molitor TaxID=7067 RepID=A0A8J6LEM7_TENMO|nr:hypothetical protein GEV33_002687 [Tenebrio molitor]
MDCLYNVAEFSEDCSHYVLTCAGPDVPDISVHSLEKKIIDWNQNEELQELTRTKRLPKSQRMSFEVEGGFKAQVNLKLPSDFDASGNTKYPMLVNVYAGPDSFQVVEKFNIDWGSYLAANKSIIYATIDGRSSGLKGNDMLFASYRRLGTVEITDQINVTKQIQDTLPYVDSRRTAIWGWSYGGYASGMILANDHEGIFKCGISVAPVTDWALYDSIYTERFMGLPTIQDNYEGYRNANLLLKYEGLRDKQYFLIHGTHDDNVHYQQSMLWAKVLEQNDILFRQLFQQRVNPLTDLSKLLKEPKSFWVALMKKYFVDNNYVAVQCIPSKDEHIKMAEEEAERIKQQINLLGEEGLKREEKLLEDAVKFNSRDPPVDMLTSLPIPSLESIKFHDIKRYRTDLYDVQQIDLSKTSVYTYFDHIKSEFIYMYALLDSTALPQEYRIYLPLMLESLFESPIRKNGKLIPYEDVIEQLNNDTVSFSSSIGLGSKPLFKCGPYSHTISVMLQVEIAKYEKGIEWLRDILYNTVFSVDRLKIISAKMNNAVAQAKRSGRDIVAYTMRGLRFVKNSNVYNNGILVQNKFLSETSEILASEKSVDVLVTCEKIWQILVDPKNVVLHLIGNLDCIPDAVEPLKTFLPSNVAPIQNKLHVTPDLELLKSAEEQPLNGCVIGMGCLESSFFHQTVDSISSYDDPDLPALMLYLQYLIQAEVIKLFRRARSFLLKHCF